MVRSVLTYVLTAVILLSQIGLPLHMHYCKGMLESVSVFFSLGCDNHIEVADLPSCCKKEETNKCSKGKGDCCDDRVNFLIQDITTLIPHVEKWNCIIPDYVAVPFIATTLIESVSTISLAGINTDSGPPIYILHQSLIFYA